MRCILAGIRFRSGLLLGLALVGAGLGGWLGHGAGAWAKTPIAAPAVPSLQAPATATERGLLWRLTSPAGKVSYLFGTMHSDAPAVTRLAAPVQGAFDNAARVVLELDMEPATLRASATVLMYADGRTLDQAIPDALYRRVVELGADKGLPELALQRMKPWAVGITLAAPPQKEGEFLDMKLANMAREQGKPVVGLETPGEQLAVFEQLTAADQVELLTGIIDEFDQLPAFYEAIAAAYAERDLDRILALSRQDLEQEDARIARVLLEGLIDDRNQRMLRRLDLFLDSGNSFVAVGALHLPGELGLVALLRGQGYEVSPVW